ASWCELRHQPRRGSPHCQHAVAKSSRLINAAREPAGFERSIRASGAASIRRPAADRTAPYDEPGAQESATLCRTESVGTRARVAILQIVRLRCKRLPP